MKCCNSSTLDNKNVKYVNFYDVEPKETLQIVITPVQNITAVDSLEQFSQLQLATAGRPGSPREQEREDQLRHIYTEIQHLQQQQHLS